MADCSPEGQGAKCVRDVQQVALPACGRQRSLKEIAIREGIDNSYVSRMVNLTTLAPDIVAVILDDTLPNHMTLFDLASGTPLVWEEQRARMRRVSEPD